jgi:hypothetical protein
MERARVVARALDLPKNRLPHNYSSLWSLPVADYCTPISDNLRLPRTLGVVGATSINPPRRKCGCVSLRFLARLRSCARCKIAARHAKLPDVLSAMQVIRMTASARPAKSGWGLSRKRMRFVCCSGSHRDMSLRLVASAFFLRAVTPTNDTTAELSDEHAVSIPKTSLPLAKWRFHLLCLISRDPLAFAMIATSLSSRLFKKCRV